MRIGILSNNPNLYSTARLKNAARKRGHTVRVLSTSSFMLDIRSGAPDVLYKGKELAPLDAIIPRVGGATSGFGTAVIRQFEQMGIYCMNPSFAVSVARDKLRTMQILSRHKIGIPPSAFIFGKSDIAPALERVGGSPVIIKLLEGTQGAGVMLAEGPSVARAIIEALQVAGHSILIQKFVSESRGRDIRAFVVGNRVIAAMRRVAQEGEFRSNVHLGANTELITLEPEFERVALRAAQILGLRVAGVDLLESSVGPQVLEINASPGLEGIEGATHVDVADEIIRYLEEQVQFPDVDLRERLSLSKGYIIAEIPVRRGLEVAGKSLAEAKLDEQEIRVLSITRDSLVLPTPRSTEVIHPGDTLLCYGKELSLRSMLPPLKAKKSRRKPAALSDAEIEATKAEIQEQGKEDDSSSDR